MASVKIRSGFVSNSSSSSFVAVCFTAPADIDERIKSAVGETDQPDYKLGGLLGITFDTDSYGERYRYVWNDDEGRPRLVGEMVFGGFDGGVDSVPADELPAVIERVKALAKRLNFSGEIKLVAGVVGDG